MEDTFGTEKAKTPQPPLFVGVINRLESLVERQLKLSQNIYGKTIRLGEVGNCVGDEPEKKTPSRETVVGEIIFLMNGLEKGIELLETSLDNLERIV